MPMRNLRYSTADDLIAGDLIEAIDGRLCSELSKVTSVHKHADHTHVQFIAGDSLHDYVVVHSGMQVHFQLAAR